MENIDSVYQTLNAIRNTGVQISIDDFGTGYSSLSHLKRLPIDAIKIDRSFIRDLISDSDDAAIVTAMLAMGRTMGMKVVAEGVMTRQQADFLVTKGCDQLHGFYFCPPVSADDLETAITEGRFVS
jgi:EAL domain-containing protein (putative c-di-GMP-specific phosphodiesterase class I)